MVVVMVMVMVMVAFQPVVVTCAQYGTACQGRKEQYRYTCAWHSGPGCCSDLVGWSYLVDKAQLGQRTN